MNWWRGVDELGSEDLYNEQGLCNVCKLPMADHAGSAKWAHRRAVARWYFLEGWLHLLNVVPLRNIRDTTVDF